MNWKRGLKRFTLVLSLLAGPIVFCLGCITWGLPSNFIKCVIVFLVFEVLGFVAIWTIYLIVAFIVEGFCDYKEVER